MLAHKKNKANVVLINLRRFTNLTPKIKTTLAKTVLIPILEYPPIPLSAVSLTVLAVRSRLVA